MKTSAKTLVASQMACALVLLACLACGGEPSKSGGDPAGRDAASESDAGSDAGAEDAGKDLLADLTKTHSAKVPPGSGALFGSFVQIESGSAQEFRAKELAGWPGFAPGRMQRP